MSPGWTRPSAGSRTRPTGFSLTRTSSLRRPPSPRPLSPSPALVTTRLPSLSPSQPRTPLLSRSRTPAVGVVVRTPYPSLSLTLRPLSPNPALVAAEVVATSLEVAVDPSSPAPAVGAVATTRCPSLSLSPSLLQTPLLSLSRTPAVAVAVVAPPSSPLPPRPRRPTAAR